MIISTSDIRTHQKAPTVSVVIPAYNAAKYISETLNSVLRQSFTDYEVIVVNDGSTDSEELEHIVQNHSLPVVYLTQKNMGVSAARNAAIKVSRGTLYAQLDADDQWYPEYLHTHVGILSDDPSIALVYPNAAIFGDSNDFSVEFMKLCPSEGEVTFESLVRERCTVMTSVTARMSVIKAVGMFDETIDSCEDFDLWLRIVKNGGRIHYHRQMLARYRRREGSLSADRSRMTMNLVKVLEKARNTLTLSDEERTAVNEQINLRRATLSLFQGKQALSRGDTTSALTHFSDANRSLRSRKLTMSIFVLKHIPRVSMKAFTLREFLLARRPGNFPAGIDKTRDLLS